MLIVGQKRDPLVEIKHNGWVKALTFSANGEYLLGGGENGVQVWQVDDGKQVTRVKAPSAECLAVSQDGGCIAAGMGDQVALWDAKTNEPIFSSGIHCVWSRFLV